MNVNSQQELLTVEEDILKNFNQYVSNLPGDKTVQVIRKELLNCLKPQDFLHVKLKVGTILICAHY